MDKTKKLVIIGAGETAEIACEYFTVDSEYEVVGFAVDRQFITSKFIAGLPVIPLDELELKFPPTHYWAFAAASSTKLNRVRHRLYNELKNKNYRIASYISSKAFVWRNVQIGENSFIFEDNTIQPFVKIGNNVVLWSGNHIGHNSTIQDNCFLSSHVVISGFCDIGESSFLGVNSTVINNINIGKDCFIGAGALIQKDVPSGSVLQESSTEISKVSSLRLFKIGDGQ
ncbi:acetyltransferase [Polynucleobacter nymphae]|uniref:acetyltransferase n=1 Tax=Polynucleobacter nymphae TaxID=2081043 RepID=UPI001C0ADEC7|nr:acetyltransferase [Polynucleobacter nymphae]MBU3607793.1 acetyltransferase [Polynucleobacter nymphae]